MSWIVWVTVAAVLVIFEILTSSLFFFICFSIGAIFAAIAAYFLAAFFVEFAVFIVVSVIALYLVRPIFKNITNKSVNIRSNTDAFIGLEAIVTEKITPFKAGFVKVSNEIWRAESDVEFEAGETVKIVSISGATLVVEKKGGRYVY